MFSGDGATLGLVLDTLGPDQKPVYSGTGPGLNQLTSAANFNQWYNDVDGVNFKFEVPLLLSEIMPGVFSCDDPAFFPIADVGLEVGPQYTMDIVHAERRTNQSTFRIDASIQCLEPQ